MTSRSTPRERKPQLGLHIGWRFKGNKGWRRGTVVEVLAKGRIVVIRESQYATFGGDTVAAADIDWYIA